MGVELPVEVDVAGEELDVGGGLADERVERRDAVGERRHVLGLLGPFRRQPGRRPLEDAPDFDGVPNVLDGELAGHEPAGRPGLQQAFLRQPVEHQAQWRAGDVQARRQRHLAQPFARPERAPQDELAHLEERAKGL